MKKREIKIDARELGGLGEALQYILGDIISDHLGEDNKGKIPVGKVSEDLRLMFLAWREEKQDFEEEIEIVTARLKRKMENELEERFKDRFYAMQERKRDFWKRVHKELGIPDEADLNIDPKTGVISQWVETHGSKH